MKPFGAAEDEVFRTSSGSIETVVGVSSDCTGSEPGTTKSWGSMSYLLEWLYGDGVDTVHIGGRSERGWVSVFTCGSTGRTTQHQDLPQCDSASLTASETGLSCQQNKQADGKVFGPRLIGATAFQRLGAQRTDICRIAYRNSILGLIARLGCLRRGPHRSPEDANSGGTRLIWGHGCVRETTKALTGRAVRSFRASY